jgi:hypothetical protein
VAIGPSRVLHSVSTVLAVYTVDAASGSQVASKTFALQDLFAPVGAANCRYKEPWVAVLFGISSELQCAIGP